MNRKQYLNMLLSEVSHKAMPMTDEDKRIMERVQTISRCAGQLCILYPNLSIEEALAYANRAAQSMEKPK